MHTLSFEAMIVAALVEVIIEPIIEPPMHYRRGGFCRKCAVEVSGKGCMRSPRLRRGRRQRQRRRRRRGGERDDGGGHGDGDGPPGRAHSAAGRRPS